MSDGEETPEKHRGLKEPWKPGQSGNPSGRPKGARSKLSETFLAALAEDFERHGAKAIQKTRATKPAEYLKVIASLLPKQVEIKEGAFDGIGDDELAALIVAAREALGAAPGGRAGGTDKGGKEPPEGLSSVH